MNFECVRYMFKIYAILQHRIFRHCKNAKNDVCFFKLKNRMSPFFRMVKTGEPQTVVPVLAVAWAHTMRIFVATSFPYLGTMWKQQTTQIILGMHLRRKTSTPTWANSKPFARTRSTRMRWNQSVSLLKQPCTITLQQPCPPPSRKTLFFNPKANNTLTYFFCVCQ